MLKFNHRVVLEKPPKRIVSLVPSQTQLLADLGLSEEVQGITKFCVHPRSWRKEKTVVGGTKKINFDRIDALKPDLIIANKEENNRKDVEQLAQNYPVYVSDISTLREALTMISDVGLLCNREDKALRMTKQIRSAFSQLRNSNKTSPRVVYLIWKTPWMAAGSDTFINDMLKACGMINAVKALRYPVLESDTITQLNPDVVLLSSEPFPFKAKHLNEIKTLVPNSQVKLVNGEYFSWYGSMLLNAPTYFHSIQN